MTPLPRPELATLMLTMADAEDLAAEEADEDGEPWGTICCSGGRRRSGLRSGGSDR